MKTKNEKKESKAARKLKSLVLMGKVQKLCNKYTAKELNYIGLCSSIEILMDKEVAKEVAKHNKDN